MQRDFISKVWFLSIEKKICESTIGQKTSQLCLKKIRENGENKQIRIKSANPRKSAASLHVSSFKSVVPALIGRGNLTDIQSQYPRPKMSQEQLVKIKLTLLEKIPGKLRK